MEKALRFEPEPNDIRKLIDQCNANLQTYESSRDPWALVALSGSAQQLSEATTSPLSRLFTLGLGPHKLSAVSLACNLGVFNKVPDSGFTTLEELSKATPDVDQELLLRLLRGVVAAGILKQTGPQEYAHTATSHVLATSSGDALLKHMGDQMMPATGRLRRFFDENGYKASTDATNTPFLAAQDAPEGQDIFAWLTSKPRELDVFNRAMSGVTEISLKEVPRTFNFDNLEVPEGGVALVDVGGGKGHVIPNIRQAYPSVRGRWVLQDLEKVLGAGVSVDRNEVDVQPYDFLQQEQPVKGAAAYFFKSIFHDWSDENGAKILQNHISALRGHKHSRLLICDVVMKDESPDPHKVMRDLNMLTIGGKERSVKQWEALLGGSGYKILQIHGLENSAASIIEAVLDE